MCEEEGGHGPGHFGHAALTAQARRCGAPGWAGERQADGEVRGAPDRDRTQLIEPTSPSGTDGPLRSNQSASERRLRPRLGIPMPESAQSEAKMEPSPTDHENDEHHHQDGEGDGQDSPHRLVRGRQDGIARGGSCLGDEHRR